MTVHRFELNSANRDLLTEIRNVLEGTGFNESNVLERLGENRIPSLRKRRSSNAKYLRSTKHRGPLESLVRLFILEQTISANDFESAIAPMNGNDWASVGLVRFVDAGVRANVELCLYGSMIAAADWTGSNENEVMGIAPSSRALLQMTVRRAGGSVFDLGTGCGIQSIAAAKHSRSVLGSDVNPRAVQFANFNALLNHSPNIEFASADLFDAVYDRKFDLIVCNPPFVIGPRVLHSHTSTSVPADRFCEVIIRRTPSFLNEDGFAQFVCNWAQIGDGSAEERVTNWLADNGCDSWVLHSHSESAEDYAMARAEENASGPDNVESLNNEWLEYFVKENITGVHFGVITIRRSDKRKHWMRFDELPETHGDCGAAIERDFQLQDFLEKHLAEHDLLSLPMLSAPDIEIIESSSDHKQQARLRNGLMFTANINPDIAEFLMSCDGVLPPLLHAREKAKAKGTDLQAIIPRFEAVVGQMIKYGFLIPIVLSGQL